MTNPYSGNPPVYSSNSSRHQFSHTSIGSTRTQGSRPGFYHHPSRTSVISHLLQQRDPGMTSGSAIEEADFYAATNPYSSARGRDMANDQYYTSSNGSASRPAAGSALRPTQLASFSRAFELFTAPSLFDPTQPNPDGFFIPSYLSDTAYANKLRDAHQAKLKNLRAARPREGGQPVTSEPSESPTNGSIQPKSPPQAESDPFDIIEKTAAQDDPGTVAPLPTQWSKTDKWPSGIDVMNEGLEVRYTSHKHGGEYEAASIRADHPIPPECGIYYFEVSITYGRRDDTTIGIGLCTKSAALSRPPGWETDSFGYHGDDGNSFHDSNCGKTYGPKFTTGDTVGCGVNFNTGCIFFTKNGHNLGAAWRDVVRKGKIYPSVGLKKYGEHLRTNFGQSPFMFDIDGMMRREKQRIHDEIWKTSPSDLELRVKGEPATLSETDLIQSLVLQFLQHDGYVETARAFAEEIQSERQSLAFGSEAATAIRLKDDHDATTRQQIRKAILEGDIDQALGLIDTCYPNVLMGNELVYFKLKCRRFIEMVRRAAEIRLHFEGKKANGVDPAQAMDVDTNGVDAGAWDSMDTEDGPEYLDELQDLERDVIEYGQQLQAEYRSDPRKEVQKTLEDIWSLMAYPNPLREPKVSHLMDNGERSTAAEMVNSMILLSLGKSSKADLTKLYEDTSSLIRDSREGGPGAFFSMKDITASIPKREDH